MTAETSADTTNDTLSRYLKWSAGLHLALALSTVAVQWIVPAPPTRVIPTLRVDLVGLPDVLKKDLKIPTPGMTAPESPTKAKESAAPDDSKSMTLKKEKMDKARKSKLQSALARIKALEKLQSESTTEEAEPAPLLKGNILSKGSSISGDAREALESNYYEIVQVRLQTHWALPVWLSRQNLNAKVQILVDSTGRVVSFQFLEASGNPQFDAAVKKTISDAQPFPKPPKEISSSLSVHGIIIGFPL